MAAVAAPAQVRAVNPGDHMRTWRGLYWHHAIYVGDGWLIELGNSLFGGRAAYVRWGVFSKGRTVEWVSRGGPTAVARAESQLGRADFDLILRNCEHFATWCVTGRWESQQVQGLTIGTVLIGLLLVAKKAA